MKKNSRGVLYMIVSMFFFSLMHLAIKAIPRIPVHEIISFRSVFSILICLYFLRKENTNPWGNRKGLLLVRGLVGSLSLFAFFYAIRMLPLASAVTISNLIPLFTLVLAFLFLKERIYWQNWAFFILSFTGVLLIKGFDSRVTPAGLAMALSAALFTAIAHFTVRRLQTTEHPNVIVFYFPLVTIPLVLPYTALNFVLPNQFEALVLFGIGLCTHIGQVYLTKAYGEDEVSGVSNVYFLGIVLALSYGYIFFDEVLTMAGFCGIVLICVGIAMNYFFNQKKQRQDSRIESRITE